MENPECGRSEPNTKTLAANMGVQGTRDAAATPPLVRTGTKGGKQGAGLDGLVSKAPNFSPTNPPCDPPTRRRPPSERRLRWAELLKRVFELDALRCPVYPGKMRVLAAISQPDVARRILKCLSLSPRAPPIAPARLLVEHPRTPRDGCPGCQLAGRREILLRFRTDPTRGMGPRYAISRTLDQDASELGLVEHPAFPPVRTCALNSPHSPAGPPELPNKACNHPGSG